MRSTTHHSPWECAVFPLLLRILPYSGLFDVLAGSGRALRALAAPIIANHRQ